MTKTYLPRSAHYDQLHIVLFLEHQQECAWKLTTPISFVINTTETYGPSGTRPCSFSNKGYRITQNVIYSSITDRTMTETYLEVSLALKLFILNYAQTYNDN
jgi:hypothetical protein